MPHLQQQFQALTKQNKLSEYEMDVSHNTVKLLLTKLFRNVHDDVSFQDFPRDYKIFLYVPFPRPPPHTNTLYTFFVSLTTPDKKPVLLWRFQIELTAKQLHNVRHKPDALKYVYLQNIQYSPVQKQLQLIKKQKQISSENILQRIERLEYNTMKRMDFLEDRINKLERMMEHYSQTFFNKSFWQQHGKQKTQQKQKQQKCLLS